MADTINENVYDLTSIQIQKIALQLKLRLLDADSRQAKNLKNALENLEKQERKKKALLDLDNKLVQDIEKEVKTKKILNKSYQEQVKLIEQSGVSWKKQAQAIKEVQKAMDAKSRKVGLGGIYDTSITLGTLGKSLKGLRFGEIATSFAKVGGTANLLRNTFAALGGTAGLATTGIGMLAAGAKIFYDNVLAPSARMRNVAGQQLGIGAANRNLFGGQFLKEWANRFSLGYSAEEQQGLFSTLVGAIRLNPEKNTALYENSLQGLMSAQRIWGVDNATLGAISKAYSQVGVSAERLGSKFDVLMRNVDGTGWTTSEYSTVLAKNVMYLKNFGVNIDTFAQELKGYGNLVRQEKLTLQDVSTGGWQRENTGNLAFMAQEFLRSGIISEQELGAGLGDTVFAQAGALKEYLGKKIKAGEISEIVRLFESNPMFRGLMESSGALGSKYAFKELLSTAGLPLSSEIASVFEGKSATDAWNIAHGRLGATSSGETINEKSLKELSDEARKNYAATSNSLKRLLLEIANLIRKEADNMGTDNPLDFKMQ